MKPVGHPDPPDRSLTSGVGLGLVLTLFGFAVAQPLYDLVGRFPAFFIFRQLKPTDFFLFIAFVSLVLPAAWWLVLELLGRAVPPSRRLAYKISLGVLSAAALLPWFGSIGDINAWVATALSAAMGMVISHLVVERAGAKKFVLFLVPSVFVFAAILLLRPGVKELWLPQGAAEEGGAAGSASTPPIVLLVLDGLPTVSLMNDQLGIDEERYPAFARLAREGTWYRRASTVSTKTTEAVPAILAGRCPGDFRQPTFESYPSNLFTFLSGTYDLDVVESVTQLCPTQLCAPEATAFTDRFLPLLQDASIVLGHRLLPPAWTTGLPPVDKNWGGFGAAKNASGRRKRSLRDVEIERYREMIARIGPTERPTFRFAHVVLPHEPFLYLPSGTLYRGDTEAGGTWKTLADDPSVAWHGYQRHLLQLGYVDGLLAELLAALDEADLYDEALIVVTADHGSAFIPGQPRRELGQTNLVDLVAVPLLVKLPSQRGGGIDDSLVQTVDLTAIVADVLGLDPPSWTEARNSPIGQAATGGLSCGDIRHQAAFHVTLDDLRAAVDRKTSRFGTGAEALFPHAGPRPDVLGVATASASCPPMAGVHATIENEALFANVDPASGFVPAEIVGTIYGPEVRQLDLAVAVNGNVRATTTPYQLGSAGATFAAIVPEEALSPGRNEVEIFALSDVGRCRLRPLAGGLDQDASLLDIQLGAWPDPRVGERGFAKTTRSGDTVMRWTRGRARLEVPLPPDQAARLRAIRVDLRGISREGSDLRVQLGPKVLYEGRVEEAPWSRTFPVGDWKHTDPARILIHSSTFKIGSRQYGVGVEGIWLLSDAQ